MRITLCRGIAAGDEEATAVVDRIAGPEGGEVDGKMGWVHRTVSSKKDESAIAMKVSPGWNLPVYTIPQLDKNYSRSALFQIYLWEIIQGRQGVHRTYYYTV